MVWSKLTEQAKAPACANDPGGHWLHALMPADGAAVPLAQLVQLVALAVPLNVPLPQFWQVVLAPTEYVPLHRHHAIEQSQSSDSLAYGWHCA